MRLVAAVVAALLAAGCGTTSKEGEGSTPSWLPNTSNVSVPFVTPKGTKTTLISELKPGAYHVSSLAIGAEKDLARQRGEGLGYVRLAPMEQYLAEVRAKLVAGSGVTGVPGWIVILANPAMAAYSTADGNVYVAMAWVESFENTDEVAALLAHELAHVLLGHHTSDLFGETQKKALALHEMGVAAKQSLGAKTASKSDKTALANEQILAEVTDKVALPAWSRRQEREADLLGVDLMVRAGYAPRAMVSMLRTLHGWEKQNKEPEDAFWDRVKQTAASNPGEAFSMAYHRGISAVSVSHPKTEERIEDTAEYLERHYANLTPAKLQTGPWKAVTGRPDVSQVLQHYQLAFGAKATLDKGKTQDAYASAKDAASGRTATDAYPNWVVYRAASALGRQREALDALRRAITSPEPVPVIYEDLIFVYERQGNTVTALDWTNKAIATFGEAPRWTPTKIRLLRKLGRTREADTLALSCSVNTPDWKRECQDANKTPAGRPSR